MQQNQNVQKRGGNGTFSARKIVSLSDDITKSFKLKIDEGKGQHKGGQNQFFGLILPLKLTFDGYQWQQL